MFRLNDPNLGHVSTHEAMTEYGLAYLFGVFMGWPRRWKIKRSKLAHNIANQLDKIASEL